MAGVNRKSGGGAGLDVKQVLFMVVGLIVGAGVIFVAGLQVGQHLDLSAASLATATMTTASNPRSKASKAHKAPNDDFSFFAELDAPAPERMRRKLDMPEGNANNPDSPEKRNRLQAGNLARQAEGSASRPPVTRSLKRAVERDGRDEGAREPLLAATVDRGAEEAPQVARRLPVESGAAREPEAGGRFTVHVGSFVTFDEASKVMGELRAKGHSPSISLATDDEGVRVYRVRVGSFTSQDAAREVIQSSGGRGRVIPL